MGVEELTKGRTTSEWLKILYEVFREEEKELPEYEAFIKEGCYVPCEEGAEIYPKLKRISAFIIRISYEVEMSFYS